MINNIYKKEVTTMSAVFEVIFNGGSFADFWNALLKVFGLEHLGDLINWFKNN